MGNTVSKNVALQNVDHDLQDDNGGCATNIW